MSREAVSFFQLTCSSDRLAVVHENKHDQFAQEAVTGTLVTMDCGYTEWDDNSTDEILVKVLCSGSKYALTILFRRYARLVGTIARRILRNEAEADDLVQEVFLFIFRKADLFNAALGSVRSWIVQVTYHRAIDRRRHLTSRHFYNQAELDDDVISGEASRTEIAFYEESMEGILGRKTLQKLEESLSEDQRRVLQLYFFEGYSLSEIARDMGQTVGNIRNHYYRGLEKMRRHIFEAKLQAK